jgi:SPP1 family predicted phage head-tail adaptor
MSRNTNDRSDIAGKDNISDDITFRIRYTTSKIFTNKLVISYQSNLYNINSVINEGDNNSYFLIGCSTLK